MNINGYYKDKKNYTNEPINERELFKDSLLEYLGKNDRVILGVELGVLWADTSSYILSLNEKINLIGIDPIIPDSMNVNLVGDENTIINKTKEFGSRFIFKKDFSHNVVNEVPEEIDFLFIDASHHYEDVKQDYNLFGKKVISGGLIYFHDSRMNRGGAPWHHGSSKFVDELIKNNTEVELIGEAFSLTCFIKK